MRRELLLPLLMISAFLPAASSATVSSLLPAAEFETLQRIATVLKKTDWNFSVDPCSQEAGWVTPNAPNGAENSVWCNNCTEDGSICHVTSIVLKSQNLMGTLPREMALLTFLQEIDLTRNFLSGIIPDEWAVLPLVNVSLLGNNLSGIIPSWIGNITSLTNLALEANQFTGSLPKELGYLRGLVKIQFSSNAFSGELPDTLINLSNLIYFTIGSNNFTGQIPQFLQNWTQIQRIDLQASGLQGPIPTGLPLLVNLQDLRISDISGNSVFPQLEGMQQQMTYLTLRNCGITGEIPPYIGSFLNLKRLGYMAPEYATRGYLTEKADVYSFGIVTLEIVSGKCVSSYMNEERYHLLDLAHIAKERGDLLSLVDKRLENEFTEDEALGMIRVAILCSHSSPVHRPSMSSVVKMLTGEVSIPDFTPDPYRYRDILDHSFGGALHEKGTTSGGNMQSLYTGAQENI